MSLDANGLWLHTSATDIGQGSETTLCQIAADTLGVDLCQIRVSPRDTAKVPNSGATSASRTCAIVGRMVKEAAAKLMESLKNETGLETEDFWALAAARFNPIPIYVLGFAEGGNVYESLSRADFFNLNRSAGLGARLQINPIGMVGFDYGYGFDDVYPKDGKPDGWRFHFVFGRGM